MYDKCLFCSSFHSIDSFLSDTAEDVRYASCPYGTKAVGFRAASMCLSLVNLKANSALLKQAFRKLPTPGLAISGGSAALWILIDKP